MSMTTLSQRTHVRAIPNQTLVCMRIIPEALLSRGDYSTEQIRFVTDTICQGRDISLEQLAYLILFVTPNTNAGRFAVIFNEQLRSVVDRGDRSALMNLVSRGGHNFVELYDNSALTEAERQSIARMVDREYSALLSTLQQGSDLQDPLSHSYLPCAKRTVNQVSVTDGKSTKSSGLYTRCYNEICIYDQDTGATPDIPQTVFVPDPASGSPVMRVYCFEIMPLVHLLVTAGSTSPINPQTGATFSSLALQLLQQKFSKEIKMYTRSLQR